jgi:organic radical activating enzyme
MLLSLETSPKKLTYPIVETFHSIQGEGFWMGINAFFIRLGGCDVGCPWCDTKISWNAKLHPQRSIIHLLEEINTINPGIIIITGGEPLLHNLNHLTEILHQHNFRVHLETSGAHPFSGNFDWVTFSPKMFKPPHPSIYSQVNELKVVIKQEADLLWAEEQATKLNPQTVKYLQPEWNTPESQELVFQYVLKYPQWRVSLQTHKLMGVR